VLPELQRCGIGGRLIRYGLDLLRERGEQIVIVPGHPDYYSRFGFSSEKARALESRFPPEAFSPPGQLSGFYAPGAASAARPRFSVITSGS
jgi:hypothetical protein